MTVLCVDIGGGTQDICIYTGADSVENSIKMVLHTPAKHIAAKMKGIDGDLFISGGAIGGGWLLSVCKERVAKGNSVFITRDAAKTLRDDLEYVKKTGITVVEEVLNPDIVFDEFDYDIMEFTATRLLGEGFSPDVVAVAAQDHGYIAGQSDRITRFAFLKEFLKNGLRSAFFTNACDIPENFSRWRSLAASVKAKCPQSRLHLSDTAVIAALGAASITDTRPLITVDAGNCHTFAALIGEGDKVLSFFEHHTHVLNPEKVTELLRRLASGELVNDEVFLNDGHGAHIFEKVNAADCKILVTGPNREKLFTEGGNVVFADPKGDTMMTGPVGLLIQTGAI